MGLIIALIILCMLLIIYSHRENIHEYARKRGWGPREKMTLGVDMNGNNKNIQMWDVFPASNVDCSHGGGDCHICAWHDGSGTMYANKCSGTNVMHTDHTNHSYLITGYNSGSQIENFIIDDLKTKAKATAGTFSNTLQRRLGMEKAGAGTEKFSTKHCVGTFDCQGENFTATKDIAANTMYGGYYTRAALPG